MRDMTESEAENHFGKSLWSKLKETPLLNSNINVFINSKGQFVYRAEDIDSALIQLEKGLR
jgi:S-adenosylmethionine synthetase